MNWWHFDGIYGGGSTQGGTLQQFEGTTKLLNVNKTTNIYLIFSDEEKMSEESSKNKIKK